MTTIPRFLLPVITCIFAFALPGTALADEPPSATEPFTAEHYVGQYHHSGGEAEAEALAELVDETAAGFNLLLRPIARGRLEKTVVVPERIEIVSTDGALSVKAVGSADLPDEPSLEDGAIVVQQSSLEGSRRTSFRLREDGTTLIMRVTTASGLLPDGIDYQLTFQRTVQRISEDLVGASTVQPVSVSTSARAQDVSLPEESKDAGT
jgi:hypothetical protein